MSEVRRVGLVGARGHAGAEFIRLVGAHPELELGFAASRRLAGAPVAESVLGWEGPERFVEPHPDMAELNDVDVVVLALPNGVAADYMGAIDAGTVVVDFSADHRFDDSWVYGLPELRRDQIVGSTRISNPGCYASAAMLGLAPLIDGLDGEPSLFGVSGYTGAGTDPSPRNDPDALRDNVMPYAITGHGHEREVSYQSGHRVRFAPSVAPFARGLVTTILATLGEATDIAALATRYRDRFDAEPLIELRDDAPTPRDAVGRPNAIIGGFSVDPDDPHRVGVVVALDNLLKGASSQAMQNLNLACGFEELTAIVPRI